MKNEKEESGGCTRRQLLQSAAALTAASMFAPTADAAESPIAAAKPNFVVMYADDMGYGDWNGGGNPTIRTPNLNRMAAEGVHLTQFYSGNPVCSPSRAALLTGRNNIRTGIIEVFFPGHDGGLSTREITLAEALKPLGYASACIGKWHLGCTPKYRPLRRGFDYYYGLLYSNDMDHPDLWKNDECIEAPAKQDTLTRRYTEEAIAFLERSKDRPFFLYVPYTMPHVPLAASEKFRGRSPRGLFGDVIEELDWSVGQINAALDRLGLSGNTLVLFASDNGPWLTKNQNGGTAGQLRGGKGDTFEGGMRVPCLARWPGRLQPATVATGVGSVLDLLPTFVKLAGGSAPIDRPIDGVDLMPVLEGKSTPDRILYYYRGRPLRAVRKGRYKLHLSYYDPSKGDYGNWNAWVAPESPLLFNLEVDPSERFDIAAKNPDIVAELKTLTAGYEEEIQSKGENRELLEWFIKEWPEAPRTWKQS